MCMAAPKIVFPDQGENWCGQCWRHTETIDVSCTAQFATHDEIKRFIYIKQVVMRTSGIINSAMHCSIWRVSIWNFQLVFEPHVQRDWVSALLFVFLDKFWSLLFFFGIVRSIISRNKINWDRGPKLNASIIVHELHRVQKSSLNSYNWWGHGHSDV